MKLVASQVVNVCSIVCSICYCCLYSLMATLPCAIPPLPPNVTPWPANLLITYDTLSDIYQHALQLWRQEDHNPLCLEYHLGSLQGNAMHLLEAIEADPIGSDLTQWLTDTTELVGQLYVAITCYHDNICNW